LGVGLAVTGRIRDIGQKVLQSSFQAGSSGSPSYFHISFLIAFLEEDFIENVIIIICFTYNKDVINNNYGKLKNLTLLLKITKDKRKNIFDICKRFGQAPSIKFASPELAELKNPFLN
jgi:hypothetical protein